MAKSPLNTGIVKFNIRVSGNGILFEINSARVIIKGKRVQYRKWSPTTNDPKTANDPQNGPQMIPKVDRKWSRKKNRNDLDSSYRTIVSILLLLQ